MRKLDNGPSPIRDAATRAPSQRPHYPRETPARPVSSPEPYSREAVRNFRKETTSGVETKLNAVAAEAAVEYRAQGISPPMLCGIWRLVELCALFASAFVVLSVFGAPAGASFASILLGATLAAVTGSLALQLAGAYAILVLRTRLSQHGRVTAALFVSLFVLVPVLLAAGSPAMVPGDWLPAWFFSALTLLIAARTILSSKIRVWVRNGFLERRAVIVGGGSGAEALIRSLEMQPDSHIRVCGIFDDRNDRRSPPLVAGYRKLGNVLELVEFARVAHIDMLIVTLPLSAEKRVLSLLKDLWVLPLDIRLSAHSSNLRLQSRIYSFIGQVPLLDVFDRPLAEWDAVAKRMFDLVFASLALVLFSPVLLATAIAVKLDSRGPILFRQNRHGFNNQIIGVYKFRSMYHDMADPTARKVVTRGDPRVTRVGRFIRKSSIDELPQLWNVLKGELSLIGPRPHAVHAVSSGNEAFVEIVDGYFGRHKVKPGITGWAQIKGFRGEVDQPDKLKKRFEYDLDYIENWSILFDLYILFATPFSLLKSENAY